MAHENRIYLVKSTNGEGRPHLVRAQLRQQALRHVTRTQYTVKVATQDDLVALLNTVGIEDANTTPDDMETET